MRWFYKSYLLACITLSLLVFAPNLSAQDGEFLIPTQITDNVPKAQLQGTAKRKILFFDVYDVRLYAPQATWSYDAPFAMHFTYLRDVSAEQYYESITKALNSTGLYNEASLNEWADEITSISNAMNEGDTSISLYHGANLAEFFINGELIGFFDNPDLIRAYFDIWFHEDTKIDKIRKAILGE